MKTINPEQATYNKAVTNVYFKLLKAAKELLATNEAEPVRYTLTRCEKHKQTRQITLHDFISPLLYLRLELYPNNEMAIHYGYEAQPVFSPYYHVSATFIRIVYKLTSYNGEGINLEDAIRIDWIVTSSSDAYEYLEEQGTKYHQYELLKYKPKQMKRKLRKAA
jgi:hypothetical protein